jgi:hypothetical protein
VKWCLVKWFAVIWFLVTAVPCKVVPCRETHSTELRPRSLLALARMWSPPCGGRCVCVCVLWCACDSEPASANENHNLVERLLFAKPCENGEKSGATCRRPASKARVAYFSACSTC